MKRRFRLLAMAGICLLAGGQTAARETQRLGLAEKVAASDLIFVGKVLSIETPAAPAAGVGRYAVLRAERVIRGGDVPEPVKFVVRGFSQELDPDCCETGRRYLVFARRGFDVFSLDPAGASVERQGKDAFHSAVNGAYGAYLIRGRCVRGWPDRSARRCVASVSDVVDAILRATAAGTATAQ